MAENKTLTSYMYLQLLREGWGLHGDGGSLNALHLEGQRRDDKVSKLHRHGITSFLCRGGAADGAAVKHPRPSLFPTCTTECVARAVVAVDSHNLRVSGYWHFPLPAIHVPGSQKFV